VTGVVVGGLAAADTSSTPDRVATSVAAADASSTPDRVATSGAAAAGVTGRSHPAQLEQAALDERMIDEPEVSRGGDRVPLGAGDVPLDRQGTEPGAAGVASVEPPSDARDLALAMLPDYGWSSAEFSCLDDLWVGESDWDHTATNPTSGAYGIPQSLPAEKMATAGADWRTNPATQIEWGLGYIAESYGSPCAANSFKLSYGWY